MCIIDSAYRYEMGERPDIYLDLYELRHVEKDGKITEELVPNYKDRKWTFYEENEDVSMCSFGKMPKYDDLGYEITYYAQEKMKTDKEFFDYKEDVYKRQHIRLVSDIMEYPGTAILRRLRIKVLFCPVI